MHIKFTWTKAFAVVQVQRGKQVEVAWVDAATLERLLLAVSVTAGTTLGTVHLPLLPLTTVDPPRTSSPYILPRTSHLFELLFFFSFLQMGSKET